MSVTNGERLATKQDLADMYQGILPYLGGMPEMVANKFSKGDLYSTDEKMIGQWTDGKPLYQKVLNIGNMPNNTEKIIELSISDFEKAVYVDGISCDLTSSVKITRPIPYIYTPETQYSNALWLQSDNNVWNIHIKTGANRSNEIGIVTIKYTKTTDTAISIGEATDYSTEEKIVGTWIDGKPLYQKTVYISAFPSTATETNYAHNISNIDIVTSVRGIMHNSSSGASMPIGAGHPIDYRYGIFAYVNRTDIAICVGVDRHSWDGYVTIQYTKT